MLDSYLNQSAKLCRTVGTDDRGQPKYAPSHAVRCRRKTKSRLVQGPQGAIRVNETVYHLTAPIKEGDTLDGSAVKAVTDWTGLHGEYLGNKAVV